ncbi:uncharacterized protein E0L32_000623 [Thyridium curvatum]|uniref:Nucleolar protein 14 n=1 Tax=Thyridium curvatum TaxID=1093900 RepID=A0A507BA33_9PEZI|nr:uncharacterized protein E0L32_000623 [Thyridium curvatum]TPX14229.1 hypothetical protein E0L32_000623 [Thyridium curvatum]
MAGSQLKRLKASLREQGIIGPQQSKKQKKKNAQDAQARNDKRVQRTAALEGIREQFNPFQFKMNARGPKFEVTRDRPQTKEAARGIKGRPGVANSVAEERRRQTLLVDMQRRNKVGGIIDRRFGEDDPTMTPEERALERFAREKQRSHKKSSMFDLEDDEPSFGLTHMGKSLTFDEDDAMRDDFDEKDLPFDEEDFAGMDRKRLKRLRGEDDADDDEAGEQVPERKKSKQEVMKEVIAKSKLHKYERQAAKEEDEDLRAELDKELPDLQALLFARRSKQQGLATANGEAGKATAIGGVDKDEFEKAYDTRVRQMIQDRRAAPTERTKTEEEKAEEESKRLKELEEKRMKRMRGEEVSDEEEEEEDEEEEQSEEGGASDEEAEADEFGLGKGIKLRPTATELGFEDEDDFIIDDDLVASGSEIDVDEDDLSSDNDESESDGVEDDEEDEFTKGLLTEQESKDPMFSEVVKTNGDAKDDDDGVPYTFPCPQSHDELLDVLKPIPSSKLIVVIQRIRALHHPKLDSGNKEKLGRFARVLVEHIAYLGNHYGQSTSPALEGLIRHVHSLTKMFPVEVAKQFREHISEMESERPLALEAGDLVLFTAISTIFPTSDHFHQVVTPAMLAMARFLGQKIPKTLSDYATGAYISLLFIQYQQLSKRYVPEVMNFSINTLCALAPVEVKDSPGFVPIHRPNSETRAKSAQKIQVRKLKLSDCTGSESASPKEDESLKIAILCTTTALLVAAAEIWSGKPAFFETFDPALKALKHLGSKACKAQLPAALSQELERAAATLERMQQVARLSRRPLELHHHKPLAIKTYVPKFEETFDPNKHYDPNRERAEAAKLKAEHKKERKAAMRELRKDAHFMARETLRVKKAKDEAYEKKYKRLVAEIQGEEGREANAYERERQARKRSRNK